MNRCTGKIMGMYKLILALTTAFLIIIVLFYQVDVLRYPWFCQGRDSASPNSPIREVKLSRFQNGTQRTDLPSFNWTIALNTMDGNSSWKQIESKRLSYIIQKRFKFLQNPPDCNKAKKIVCNFKVRCGFGCEVHHLSLCLIVAYGTGRTLILESKGWNYYKKGWEGFFQPLSENCLDRKGQTTGNWSTADKNKKFQVLELPVARLIPAKQKPGFLPMAIPEDIAESLRKVHSNPGIWWIGEIMTYILRPQPQMQDFINQEMAALGFAHPIVGIHVRRTDKLKGEAKFHDISEYMVHAEKFYNESEKRHGRSTSTRRIFLATDEVGLLDEAKKKYPGYLFVSDNKNSKLANLSSRLSEESLKGIVVDIHLLALSDFLVCTFSSNVCRLAYEKMQHYHVDASDMVRSVDRNYWWYGQNPNSVGKVAKMPLYKGAEEINL